MIRFSGSLGSVRRSSTAKWVVVIVAAIMILIGGVFAAVAYDNYRDGEATKSWPSTSGEILSANVEEEERRDRDSDGRSRTRYTYTARVTYAYTIQGVDYTGHRIRADDSGGDRDKAFDTINDFPVGSVVDVYYDPSDPGSSVLRQGADPVAVWLFGGIGGVLLVLGVVGAVGATVVRRGARRCRNRSVRRDRLIARWKPAFGSCRQGTLSSRAGPQGRCRGIPRLVRPQGETNRSVASSLIHLRPIRSTFE